MNKLIWPAPNGVGVIDQAAWDRTVDVGHEHEEPQGGDGADQGS